MLTWENGITDFIYENRILNEKGYIQWMAEKANYVIEGDIVNFIINGIVHTGEVVEIGYENTSKCLYYKIIPSRYSSGYKEIYCMECDHSYTVEYDDLTQYYEEENVNTVKVYHHELVF